MEQAKAIVTIKGKARFSHALGQSSHITQIINVMEFEKFDIPTPNIFKSITLSFSHNDCDYEVEADARLFIEAGDEQTFYLLFKDDKRYFEFNVFKDMTTNLKVFQDEDDFSDDRYEFINDYSLNMID